MKDQDEAGMMRGGGLHPSSFASHPLSIRIRAGETSRGRVPFARRRLWQTRRSATASPYHSSGNQRSGSNTARQRHHVVVELPLPDDDGAEPDPTSPHRRVSIFRAVAAICFHKARRSARAGRSGSRCSVCQSARVDARSIRQTQRESREHGRRQLEGCHGRSEDYL